MLVPSLVCYLTIADELSHLNDISYKKAPCLPRSDWALHTTQYTYSHILRQTYLRIERFEVILLVTKKFRLESVVELHDAVLTAYRRNSCAI